MGITTPGLGGSGPTNDDSFEVYSALGKQGTEAKLGYFCKP